MWFRFVGLILFALPFAAQTLDPQISGVSVGRFPGREIQIRELTA